MVSRFNTIWHEGLTAFANWFDRIEYVVKVFNSIYFYDNLEKN